MFKIYTIQDGETIDSIASKFSTTKELLMEINGFEEEDRFANTNMMIVPNNNLPFQKHRVKKGDTIFELAKKTNTDVDTLLKINGLDEGDYIYPDEYLLLPAEDTMIYVTKDEDTLDSVAKKFKAPVEEITKMNSTILLEPNQMLIYRNSTK